MSAGTDADPLPVALERSGAGDPDQLIEHARAADILLTEEEHDELERFFGAWPWGSIAAAFMFGYETESFLEHDRELSRARRLPASQPSAPAFHGHAQTLPVAPDKGLSRVVRRRRSRRTFGWKAASGRDVAACLQAAFGVTGENEYEQGPSVFLTGAPAPGGVNTYDAFLLARDVEGYDPGTYHYLPERHALTRSAGAVVPFDRLFGSQAWCAEASCAIVLVGDLERQAARYRFPTTLGAVLIEAGARVELILLQAEELSLAATMVGMTAVGAFDRKLASTAGLPNASMTYPICAVLLGSRG